MFEYVYVQNEFYELNNVSVSLVNAVFLWSLNICLSRVHTHKFTE
jgi:hypothetical protein